MLYCSWDIVHDICNYFSFWVIFCHFTPSTSPKNQNLEKNEKNTWRYHHFKIVYKNHDHMLYCSWDMAHDKCNCYFSFRAIFCPFTALTAQIEVGAPPKNKQRHGLPTANLKCERYCQFSTNAHSYQKINKKSETTSCCTGKSKTLFILLWK